MLARFFILVQQILREVAEPCRRQFLTYVLQNPAAELAGTNGLSQVS